MLWLRSRSLTVNSWLYLLACRYCRVRQWEAWVGSSSNAVLGSSATCVILCSDVKCARCGRHLHCYRCLRKNWHIQAVWHKGSVWEGVLAKVRVGAWGVAFKQRLWCYHVVLWTCSGASSKASGCFPSLCWLWNDVGNRPGLYRSCCACSGGVNGVLLAATIRAELVVDLICYKDYGWS